MITYMHFIHPPKSCKLDEGIMLIFMSENKKSAIASGEGCMSNWQNICIWSNEIVVFVFSFDQTYLSPTLKIGRNIILTILKWQTMYIRVT